LMRNIDNMVTRIEHIEQRPPQSGPWQCQPPDSEVHEEDDDDDPNFDDGARDVNRLGVIVVVWGNHNHGNNDPFAKTKFTMIPFVSNADPEAYLDWEHAIE
jgi:hypothetical protein